MRLLTAHGCILLSLPMVQVCTQRIVVRLLPNLQRVVVGRFRSWSDADGHLRILRQLIPTARLTIIFDPGDLI